MYKSKKPERVPIYSTACVRQIEGLATASIVGPTLMQRAGLAAAELARQIIADSGKPILIFAGPGNNGGDALVMAHHLKSWWFKVTVVFSGDPTKLPPDAGHALADWTSAGGSVLTEIPPGREWSLVVDGLFGIGLQRDVSGRYLDWIIAINQVDAPVLALDIPSGLHADTGRVLGVVVRAKYTLTFIALKPGLLTADGPDHSGIVSVATLGLKADELVSPRGWKLDPGILSGVPSTRASNSHKGLFGSVGIVGGAPGMVGAALLASRAALKLGAGRVYVALLSHEIISVDFLHPEIMWRALEELLVADSIECYAIGPGLGQSALARRALNDLLQTSAALVLDADALNLLASDHALRQQLKQRAAPTIMTPHPAEAARLLAKTTRSVQDDRISAAREMASTFNCFVVLKGAGSVCSTLEGDFYINPTGNPGMASAGMGDVLTGMIAALLTQKADPLAAMLAAVYLHGAAADELVATGIGPIGLTASEVINSARRLLNRARA